MVESGIKSTQRLHTRQKTGGKQPTGPLAPSETRGLPWSLGLRAFVPGPSQFKRDFAGSLPAVLRIPFQASLYHVRKLRRWKARRMRARNA